MVFLLKIFDCIKAIRLQKSEYINIFSPNFPEKKKPIRFAKCKVLMTYEV